MSKDVMLEILEFIKNQADFIIDSTSEIQEINNLLTNMSGMVLYNSTCMCLQSIGEAVKKIDSYTDKSFLSVYYPQVPWKAVIGMRNIISHEYAVTDPEIVFNTAKDNIPELLSTIKIIIKDVESGKYDSFLEGLEK